MPNILGIGFISEKEVLVLGQNKILNQFTVINGVLKKKELHKKFEKLAPIPLPLNPN